MRIVIAGSLGSGTSLVADQLLWHLPEYSSVSFNREVAALYAMPEFRAFVFANFRTEDPEAVAHLVIERVALRQKLSRHPALEKRLQNAMAASPDVIVDFPLYLEGDRPLLLADMVVAVHCDPETQVRRLAIDEGLAPAQIESTLAYQLTAAHQVKASDRSIDTSGDPASIATQVAELAVAVQGDLWARAQRDFGAGLVWPALEAAYSEPHRQYHTLAHLRSMFYHLDRLRDALAYPLAVSLAIWFHDFVYETDERYPDNESNSVAAMASLLRSTSNPLLTATEHGLSVFDLASELILATKGHRASSKFFLTHPAAFADAHVFLDIDSSILGRETAVVERFDQDIRAEFPRYSDEEFARGRVRALEAFLYRENVFFSEPFA